MWSLARARPVTMVLAEPAFPTSHAWQPRLVEAHVGVQGGVSGVPQGLRSSEHRSSRKAGPGQPKLRTPSSAPGLLSPDPSSTFLPFIPAPGAHPRRWGPMPRLPRR